MVDHFKLVDAIVSMIYISGIHVSTYVRKIIKGIYEGLIESCNPLTTIMCTEGERLCGVCVVFVWCLCGVCVVFVWCL